MLLRLSLMMIIVASRLATYDVYGKGPDRGSIAEGLPRERAARRQSLCSEIMAEIPRALERQRQAGSLQGYAMEVVISYKTGRRWYGARTVTLSCTSCTCYQLRCVTEVAFWGALYVGEDESLYVYPGVIDPYDPYRNRVRRLNLSGVNIRDLEEILKGLRHL